MARLSFILSYRRPRSTFNRVLKERRRSISARKPEHKPARLLRYDELPEWHKDNPYILSGYRMEGQSWTCIKSIFAMHNETVNIWTHLLPAGGFALSQILIQLLIDHYYPEATRLDRFVIAFNVAAGIVTMTLSSLYHTLMCHSEHVSNLWLRIDYIGILTLILGSFFSGIHVGFRCEPTLRNIHWTSICVLSVATSILVIDPKLQGLKYRSLRTSAFVLTALSGFAPIIHGLLMYGWSQMWVRSGMPYYFLEGIVYGFGAFLFATRIPESIWPGKFDIWLGSHQLFHVLVVIASLVHMIGVWSAYEWHYENQRSCPVPV
ncbi:uncharacterized protein HMPREF1541_01651 [Cyphellophora europaea CBS 101466]|uniref:Hemolysin III family channel protein n=1 Tax=Cyphellophora europaea (strain CBS 101466) TaxID=1220924 RepID=W2S3I3_CYPE1|nr:uncharacterized protein HMPREF1541_01651 [Cyphellophora europaea CBS 101466]ETN42494.1 hypothetical protein HMPREF1541_01651 [Cyphellophora europaea CBS 101466]